MNENYLQESFQHQQQKSYGKFVFRFGKFSKDEYEGMTLDELPIKEVDEYLGWMEEIKDPTPLMKSAVWAVTQYLKEPGVAEELDRALEA